jgi:phosphotransferase system enzyme I (PtsI)
MILESNASKLKYKANKILRSHQKLEIDNLINNLND